MRSTSSPRETVLETKRAGRALAGLTGEARGRLLTRLAEALRTAEARALLEEANAEDLERARNEEREGRLAPALVKRLVLDESKLAACEAGLTQLAAMPELVGRTSIRRSLDEGLVLQRVSCPLGLIGVVFEARPDALLQIIGLSWKSGNALIAKGGREARRTNAAIADVARRVLETEGLDRPPLLLLEERSELASVLAMDDLVDLLIARGSSTFVHHVRANTRIPVVAHADGRCHIYLHGPYDAATAARVLIDAKCSYPAGCNAVETLLWEEGALGPLEACLAALAERGVELRVCPETLAVFGAATVAREQDYDTEHGALILSVRKVSGLEAALAHVARHGSRHTDAIVTDDEVAARQFLAEVDSACVFWNASTRFSDGFRFGLGAEVGISTDKLHARGPVGVEGLLTYRWLLEGSGQAASDYGPGKRPFLHREEPIGD